MKKTVWFAGLLGAALALMPAPGSAQNPKFLRAGTPIPGQYIVVLAGTDLSPIPEEPEPPPPPPPFPPPSGTFTLEGGSGNTLPNGEIGEDVELELKPDPGVVATAADLTATYGGTASDTYAEALKGFKLAATESEALAMSADPRVLFIEEDAEAEGTAVQVGPPWGLDRIDQRTLPLSNTFTYGVDGTGVNVYVIDSGILTTHNEFKDAGGNRRATRIYTRWRDRDDDCSGHGTHVAGTIGGRTYGVAKNVRLFALRLLDCNNKADLSAIINAVEYVTAHRKTVSNIGRPAVANMSLAVTPGSSALDAAVRNSIRARIVYVVAAANNNANASQFSPARVSEAITVGATEINDQRASFSNFGSLVDLFAPGVNILSASNASDTASAFGFGTSMAAPHVAGVAALYLQRNPNASPAVVHSALVNAATVGRVINPGTGSPNRLLFTNY